MTIAIQHSQPTLAESFMPGTTGWSLHDLKNRAIEHIWETEHYEIIEGVLTTMPPAWGDGSYALAKLVSALDRYFQSIHEGWSWFTEVDLILSPNRIVKPDAMFLTDADLKKQKAANAKEGNKKLVLGRILIAPSFIIESVSISHEEHDEITKRRWYAQAGVPHYWLLNAYTKTLQCLILQTGTYEVDAVGKGNATLKPSAFPGLVIPLKQLWA